MIYPNVGGILCCGTSCGIAMIVPDPTTKEITTGPLHLVYSRAMRLLFWVFCAAALMAMLIVVWYHIIA